jgi:hypothetical protein
VIVQMAGQPIRSDQDLHRVSADLTYDQTVDLLVWRNGQQVGMRARL